MTENGSAEVRAVLVDDRMYERKPDGTLVPLEDRSDWARVDAMTDEELTANAESDPDARPYSDEEWAKAAFVHPPTKVPVGLKLDADVLAIADDLSLDSSALLILFEDLWALEFGQAVVASGGELVAGGRIPRSLIDDLDLGDE